jgi:hypothetical protein
MQVKENKKLPKTQRLFVGIGVELWGVVLVAIKLWLGPRLPRVLI